jgi:hypothetical protein
MFIHSGGRRRISAGSMSIGREGINVHRLLALPGA